MRKVAMMLAVVGLCVLMFAAVALAVNKQCTNMPCFGTDGDDTLIERGGDGVNDRIYSKPGHDLVRAEIFGTDTDVLFGGKGRDRLHVDDGDKRDEVYGERGTDKCYVDARVEVDSGCEHLFVNGTKVR